MDIKKHTTPIALGVVFIVLVSIIAVKFVNLKDALEKSQQEVATLTRTVASLNTEINDLNQKLTDAKAEAAARATAPAAATPAAAALV